MSTYTPKALNMASTPDHQCGTTHVDTTAITEASVVTVAGVINLVGNFIKAGCMRKTANGYSVAVENDPKMLSVHNLV